MENKTYNTIGTIPKHIIYINLCDKETSEDAKGVIRSRQSKDGQSSDKKKRNKRATIIYEILHRKLKNPTKRGRNQVPRKGKPFLLHMRNLPW